jgi:hypothetical protein
MHAVTGSTRRRGVVAAVAVALLAAATGSIGSTATPVAQAAGSLGAGGEYFPLNPERIFDTRSGGINDVAPLGKKPTSPQGTSFTVDILGLGGVPAEVGGVNRDVLAVVANVTVADPTLPGFLTIIPAGAGAGESSLVNWNAAENVPNLAVLGVGTNGAATITLTTPNGAGSANVIIDVFGWIAKTDYPDATDAGARFRPVAPSRVLDTRTVPVPAGYPSGRPLGVAEQIALPIRGANGVVPNSANVTGAMVNITVVNGPGAFTFVSATPTPIPAGTEPATSVTNLSPGQVKANMAIVPVGADGAIHLFNRFGSAHVIVDVLGYLERGADPGTRAGRVIPLDAPFRVFDTRQPTFGSAPLGFQSREEWSFQAFADSVSLNGAALGAQSALIGNLTGVDLQPVAPGRGGSTYMTVYPGNGTPPNSSNINVTPNRAVPNTSLLTYGTVGADPYTIAAFNWDGSLHYLLDVYAVVLRD